MTTDRPYKKRRPFEEVIEDLRRNAGKQFAPEIVVAFSRAMLKEFSMQTDEKRFTRLLGKAYIEPSIVIPPLKSLLNELASHRS